MKNRIYSYFTTVCLFVPLCLIVHSCSSPKKNDLENYILEAKIKYIIEDTDTVGCVYFLLTKQNDTLNQIDNEGIKNGKWVEYKSEFVDKGLRFEGYYENGYRNGNWKVIDCEDQELGEERFYNNGWLIERKEYTFLQDKQQTIRKYIGRKLMLDTISFTLTDSLFNDEKMLENVLIYNKSGTLTKEYEDVSSGLDLMYLREVYCYNKNGQITKEEIWDKGELKETKEYDEQGNLINK